MEVKPEDFYDVFEVNPQGKNVMLALEGLFNSESSFVSGDPYLTAFNEGRRAVILFIISQLAKSQENSQQ